MESHLAQWLSDGVHYIGSTSIPGIAAKPIIDMMVGVTSFVDAVAAIPVLQRHGWTLSKHRPRTHHFFKNPQVGGLVAPTHGLHVLESTNPMWRERLAFRDSLRADDALRDEYERLKRDLAEIYRDDVTAYTRGKRNFVVRVLAEAGIVAEDWRT